MGPGSSKRDLTTNAGKKVISVPHGQHHVLFRIKLIYPARGNSTSSSVYPAKRPRQLGLHPRVASTCAVLATACSFAKTPASELLAPDPSVNKSLVWRPRDHLRFLCPMCPVCAELSAVIVMTIFWLVEH